MKEKFSCFSFSMRLFQAQSILGFVSMTLPFDKSYDRMREALFDASIAILKVSDILDEIVDGEKPNGKED